MFLVTFRLLGQSFPLVVTNHLDPDAGLLGDLDDFLVVMGYSPRSVYLFTIWSKLQGQEVFHIKAAEPAQNLCDLMRGDYVDPMQPTVIYDSSASLSGQDSLEVSRASKLIQTASETDAASIARFEEEVKATAKLTRWNTFEIYDHGRTDDGTFYYVMELLPGKSLEELVEKHGPLPHADAFAAESAEQTDHEEWGQTQCVCGSRRQSRVRSHPE